MSGRPEQHEQLRIPLSVVMMSIGTILLMTAFAAWRIIPKQAPTTVQLVPTAIVIATIDKGETAIVQPAKAVETPVALLPETPLEQTTFPAHYVSALEAAKPNIGQPIRIVIPQLELDANIAPIGLQALESNGEMYYQWMVPAEFKAGWHNTSARLGTPGNTVLNGHHNIHGEVFRDIVDLDAGAQIIIHDPEQSYVYEVQEIHILEERDQPLSFRQENALWISETADERITLVTCWPYTDNSHRVIVVAYPMITDISIQEVK
jgi:LPXTG-site transpeptidase (sortase) family protein